MAAQTEILLPQPVTASGSGVAVTDGTVTRQWMLPSGMVLNEQVASSAVVRRAISQVIG